MALLPAHLDRALRAVCGRISEGGRPPLNAAIAEVEERMADPPPRAKLEDWLGELVALGLLAADRTGWRVTPDGWRAVNLVATPDPEADL